MPYELKEIHNDLESISQLLIKQPNSDRDDRESHYILSDDKDYKHSELIVGLDNIRDHKITNQIKLDE
jgi:hypothetical protein